MNKQQEEVKAEAPAETMEDYAAELEASLGLSTPVAVCRNLHFAHGVMFDTVFHE